MPANVDASSNWCVAINIILKIRLFLRYLEIGVGWGDPLAAKVIIGGELLCQHLVLHHPLDVTLDYVMRQLRYLPGKPRFPGRFDHGNSTRG